MSEMKVWLYAAALVMIGVPLIGLLGSLWCELMFRAWDWICARIGNTWHATRRLKPWQELLLLWSICWTVSALIRISALIVRF